MPGAGSRKSPPRTPQRGFNALFSDEFPVKYLRVGVTAHGSTVSMVVPFGVTTTAADVGRDVARMCRERLRWQIDATTAKLAVNASGASSIPDLREIDPRVALVSVPAIIERLQSGADIDALLVPLPALSQSSPQRRMPVAVRELDEPRERTAGVAQSTGAAAEQSIWFTGEDFERALDAKSPARQPQPLPPQSADNERIAALEAELQRQRAETDVLRTLVISHAPSSTPTRPTRPTQSTLHGSTPSSSPRTSRREDPRTAPSPTSSDQRTLLSSASRHRPNRLGGTGSPTLGDYLPIVGGEAHVTPLTAMDFMSGEPQRSPPRRSVSSHGPAAGSMSLSPKRMEQVVFVHPLLPDGKSEREFSPGALL